MHLFYIPETVGKNYKLSEEESKHCIKTLRLKCGSFIFLTDGKGNLYKAAIVSDNPRLCLVEIVERISNYEPRSYYIHLAIAPTKNIDRFEWFTEKAVEIGVDEITPLICEHSERKKVNSQRLERIAIAAMKQSIKAYLPSINPCISFNNFIKTPKQQTKLIAFCPDELEIHQPVKLSNAVSEKIHSGKKSQLQVSNNLYVRNRIDKVYQKGQSVVILIGPEGDFSPSEISNALATGFVGVTLGNSRLRTETAGIVTCQTIYYLNS